MLFSLEITLLESLPTEYHTVFMNCCRLNLPFFSLVLSPLIVEHYYTTNIQKNQLVQNDIRIAKRLQDEEEARLAQQSTVLRQTSRQL